MSRCHGAMLEKKKGGGHCTRTARRVSTLTHLGFLQTSVDLPEVFCEEIFSDGLPVDSDSLSDLDQVRGTVDHPIQR